MVTLFIYLFGHIFYCDSIQRFPLLKTGGVNVTANTSFMYAHGIVICVLQLGQS